MKFLIWVVVLLYQDSLALAQTLRVGLLDFPPFAMESEEEYLPVRGIIAERLVKALGRTGYKYDIKIYPAKRLFLYFKNNTLDFIIPSQSQIKRFKDIAVFSDKPILNLQLRAYSYSKDTRLPENKNALSGKRVTLIRGYSYFGLLDYINDPSNRIEKRIVNNHESGLLQLVADRTDLFLDYSLPAEYVIKNLGKHEFKHSNLFSQNIYFAISKKYPDCGTVLNRIIREYEDNF